MATIEILSAAPTATHYCNALKKQESALERHEVAPGDLLLLGDGTLEVRADAITGVFHVAEDTPPDLANLARIPTRFFEKQRDDELRRLCFNYRVGQGETSGHATQIVLRNGTVDRILNRNLLPAPRAAILDTVLNAKADSISTEEVRAIVHHLGRMLDISLIAPALTREPRKNDVVAFGVNVIEAQDGAIQIRGAAFRCWCSNGAINRICDNQNHRLRRPLNHLDRQHSFLKGVASFAKAAWYQWQEHADGLTALTGVSIDPKDRASLRSRLTQRPFFLSHGLADRVANRLIWEAAQHQQTPSLYDLYNAMTYLADELNRSIQC